MPDQTLRTLELSLHTPVQLHGTLHGATSSNHMEDEATAVCRGLFAEQDV